MLKKKNYICNVQPGDDNKSDIKNSKVFNEVFHFGNSINE